MIEAFTILCCLWRRLSLLFNHTFAMIIFLSLKYFQRKLQLEKEARELTASQNIAILQQIAPAVKFQRYTILPFYGYYKDLIRFWNQFSVEVGGAAISEMSEFHYPSELTKGKPREDVLGLPHTIEQTTTTTVS